MAKEDQKEFYSKRIWCGVRKDWCNAREGQQGFCGRRQEKNFWGKFDGQDKPCRHADAAIDSVVDVSARNQYNKASGLGFLVEKQSLDEFRRAATVTFADGKVKDISVVHGDLTVTSAGSEDENNTPNQ